MRRSRVLKSLSNTPLISAAFIDFCSYVPFLNTRSSLLTTVMVSNQHPSHGTCVKELLHSIPGGYRHDWSPCFTKWANNIKTIHYEAKISHRSYYIKKPSAKALEESTFHRSTEYFHESRKSKESKELNCFKSNNPTLATRNILKHFGD